MPDKERMIPRTHCTMKAVLSQGPIYMFRERKRDLEREREREGI